MKPCKEAAFYTENIFLTGLQIRELRNNEELPT